jgi:hypothetical protein
MMHRRRTSLSLLLATAALLLLAALAIATPLKKNATYKGTTAHDGLPISFKVSSSGKTAKANMMVAPAYCEGGSAGVIQLTKPASISSKGAFKGTISYEFAPEHKIIAKAYFSGKFSGKSVKGTLRSEFLLAKQCSGSTTFSAKTK